jgi:proteasome lid subunit RPN8/RPN11
MAVSISAFLLPYPERRRLHRRALRAQQNGHFEVCGMVAVDARRRLSLWFVENEAKVPYRYDIQSSVLRLTARRITARGLRPLATFHSHPIGYAAPTKGDLRHAFFKSCELVYDVCGRTPRMWRRRRLRNRIVRVTEIPLKLEPRPTRKLSRNA